jgi:hypothetical protein
MANRKSIRSEVPLPIFGPARPRLSDHPGRLITFGDTVYPGRSTRAETARALDPVAGTGPQQEVAAPVDPEPRTTRQVPRSEHVRIRTWVEYGLTIPQVAEVYGVAVGVIERILRRA